MTIPRRLIGNIAATYTVLVLILSTDAFLTVLVAGNDPSDVSKGSLVTRSAWALVYAVTLVGMIKQWRSAFDAVRANKAMFVLVGLAFVSVLWSIDRGNTVHGAVILLFTMLFALDMSLRYSLIRQIQMIRIALLVVVGMSILVELVLPGAIPRNVYEGAAWHGVFSNKNVFGRIVALAVAVCLVVPRLSKWSRVLIVASGIVLGILARSAGTVGYQAGIVGLFLGWPILKWKPKRRKVALVGCAVLVAVMTYVTAKEFAAVTTSIGRDPHLTGRATLWELSLVDIQRRPILGYGYAAFWGKTSQPARLIREESRWEDAPHAHNGYIDLTLGVGLIGLGAYGALFGNVARRAYSCFMGGQEGYRKWPLTFLAFIFLYQVTESSVVSGGTIFWILLCSLTFSLAQKTDEAVAPEAVALHEFAGERSAA